MTQRPYRLSLAVLTQGVRKAGRQFLGASGSLSSVHRIANEQSMEGVLRMAVPMPKVQRDLASADAARQADPS